MDSLKGVLSKGLTTLNVKTNNFMEESKCKTYISTLEKEIKDLKFELGDLMYDTWKNGNDNQSRIEEDMATIKTKEENIEQQKEIMKNLAVEEQQILGNRPAAAATGDPQAAAIVFCPNCGAQSSVGFKFCSKCGSPLA